MKEMPSYEELKQKVKDLEKKVLEHQQAEKSLLRENHFSKTIIDSLPGIFYFFDEKGKYVEWNKNHEELTEYSAKEISKMSPIDFFVEEDKKRVFEQIQEVFIKGRSFVEAVVETKSGNKISFYLTGQRVLLNNKNYLVGMGIDITERKRAEDPLRESKQFLSAVFDSIQDGISVLDSELNIVRVNQTMREWFAHRLPLEGKKCFEAYYGRTEACKLCPTLRTLESGRLEMDELTLFREEGATGTVELFVFPILDDTGKPAGVVEYIRDITKRKRAEKALKESAEKIKMFAYSVSHDIKNPAIGIYLLAKHLNENYKDILDEKGKKHCDQIMKASEDLAALVDQINVYISTKEAPLIIERVNLNQVFDTVRDEFAARILVRQISWSQPENLLEIDVDRLSILRVIRNFVDNALKYGGDELSEINIGYEETDGFHILSIKDDGIGIAEKDSGKIFSPFERSVTSIGIEGTGLGLAIAHEIANQHKGKVWTEPGPEKGIILYISISKDLKLTK